MSVKNELPVDHLPAIRTLVIELGDARSRAQTAVQHLRELARDYARPRGGLGGGRSGGGTHSDPTAQAATDDQRRAEGLRLQRDADEIVQAMRKAREELERAEKLTSAVLDPKRPVKLKPGCEICDTVRGADGKPHHLSYQAVKARGLCGWHYRFIYGDGPDRPGFGEPPTMEINRWHLDHLGEEIRPSVVRDQMPEAFAVREARKRRPDLCHQPTFIDKTEGTCARPFMHEGQCLDAAHLDHTGQLAG